MKKDMKVLLLFLLFLLALVSIAAYIVPTYREEDVHATARLIADNLAKRCGDMAISPELTSQCLVSVQEEASARAKKKWQEWEKMERLKLLQKLTR